MPLRQIYARHNELRPRRDPGKSDVPSTSGKLLLACIQSLPRRPVSLWCDGSLCHVFTGPEEQPVVRQAPWIQICSRNVKTAVQLAGAVRTPSSALGAFPQCCNGDAVGASRY